MTLTLAAGRQEEGICKQSAMCSFKQFYITEGSFLKTEKLSVILRNCSLLIVPVVQDFTREMNFRLNLKHKAIATSAF